MSELFRAQHVEHEKSTGRYCTVCTQPCDSGALSVLYFATCAPEPAVDAYPRAPSLPGALKWSVRSLRGPRFPANRAQLIFKVFDHSVALLRFAKHDHRHPLSAPCAFYPFTFQLSRRKKLGHDREIVSPRAEYDISRPVGSKRFRNFTGILSSTRERYGYRAVLLK